MQGKWDSLVSSVRDSLDGLDSKQKYGLGLAAAGVAGVGVVSYLLRPKKPSRPSTWQLTGGSISRDAVAKEFKEYSASYGAEGTGTGITDRERTVQLVDVFYSLVTDIYEWGWGQSFHFSPRLPHKGWEGSEAAHEARVATVLRAGPGKRILDCGCGVGGPMRTVAAVSGAHVVGITINDYQVQRAQRHNERQGLAPLTSVIRGDFTSMPFESNTFDGAYAIEATCHAPKLETVYGEIFRVLKPGATFVSYEWVSTPNYNPKNPEHIRIMDEINFGNGLPEMRSWKDAEEAGKKVGFELVQSIDLARASIVCGPWYSRLSNLTWMHNVNHCIVSFFDFLRLTPKGMKEVHQMLVRVARSLIAGGESKTFTPMQMLVFHKPGRS